VKRNFLSPLLSAVAAVLLIASVRAETYTSTVTLSPANEVPPIAGLNASGTTLLTINVVRDPTGAIVTGSVNFLTNFTFPGSVTITGHHIHEQVAGVNGSIVINPAFSSTTFASGTGMVSISVTGVNPAVLGRLLANPAGFYVNLHTSANPGGAMRAQLTTLSETVADTVAMTTASEVPPVTTVNAFGTATITVKPTRNVATGAITGGSVNFTVNYNFPGSVTITGLHIHQAAAGVNGSIVINTGVSGGNPVVSSTGTGVINATVASVSATLIQGLLSNPAGFYVNLHTSVNPGGVIRGQLEGFATPPVIEAVSPYVVQAGSAGQLTLTGTGFASAAAVLINGQIVGAAYNGTSNPAQLTGITIPAALAANPGTLTVQVQDINGVLTAGRTVTVAAAANINSVAPATIDAARFGASVAPESIAALFGTNLATTTVAATSVPLPTSLDGTTVYVNGTAAPLFFVSQNQVNYQIPPGVAPGAASVVVVDKNGNVSQGQVTVAPSIAAIFTAKADGAGAPAGVASVNGQTFNIPLANPDGTPAQLDLGTAGLFVSLFGTGLRYAPNKDGNTANGVAESVSITIDGTLVTPATLFAGAQGTFAGLDQINFQIPTTFAGKGPVDMIVNVDGKASNTLKLNIK